MSLLGMFDRMVTRKITKFGSNSEEDFSNREESRLAEFPDANVVTSLEKPPPVITPSWFIPDEPQHYVALDIDVEAYLIPSSTEGHSHLYINRRIDQSLYFELLDVLARCNIIERGYAEASKKKGYTSLRLPWVKKGQEDTSVQTEVYDKWAVPETVVPF